MNNRMQKAQAQTKAIPAVHMCTSGENFRAPAASDPAAVVVTVIITDMVVCEALKLSIGGLKLHVLAGGRFKQPAGDSVVEPASPPCSLNVSVMEPDWPGPGTTMVVEAAAIVRVATVSVSVVGCVPNPVEKLIAHF